MTIDSDAGWGVSVLGVFEGGDDEWHFGITETGESVGYSSTASEFDGIYMQVTPTEIRVHTGHAGALLMRRAYAIPPDVTYFRGFYNIYNSGGRILGCGQRFDQFVSVYNTGNITAELDPATDGSIRALDTQRFGVTVDVDGDRVVHLTHIEGGIEGATRDVPVHVAPLYIHPIHQPCGSLAIEGSIIEFESNGGQGGIFTASGGTILDGLRWQAPVTTGTIVNFLYEIGEASATCTLQVQPELLVYGVQDDGFYGEDMAQGEILRLLSSVPATFSSPNYPELISPSGTLIAPHHEMDEVFGEKIVEVRVEGAMQVYTFKVRIQAMYPSIQFCGPDPQKWLPRDEDYLPNTLTMLGGTSQVKNRNEEGVLTWEIAYVNLIEKGDVACLCPPENPFCPCELATAERLSNFYRAMDGYVKYFTVVDIHSGELFKYVRMTRFERDHDIFSHQQLRTVSLRQEGKWLFTAPEYAASVYDVTQNGELVTQDDFPVTSTSVTPPAFNLAARSDLLFYYEADQTPGYINGSNVIAVPDLGPGNLDLAELTNPPKYRTALNGINGLPAFEFDGVNDQLLGTVAVPSSTLLTFGYVYKGVSYPTINEFFCIADLNYGTYGFAGFSNNYYGSSTGICGFFGPFSNPAGGTAPWPTQGVLVVQIDFTSKVFKLWLSGEEAVDMIMTGLPAEMGTGNCFPVFGRYNGATGTIYTSGKAGMFFGASSFWTEAEVKAFTATFGKKYKF